MWAPMQGGAERRRRADHVEPVGALLDVADQVALGVVVGVALVDDGDDRARTDDAGLRRLDDLDVSRIASSWRMRPSMWPCSSLAAW